MMPEPTPKEKRAWLLMRATYASVSVASFLGLIQIRSRL
jgi:hypothetical protein